MNIQILPDTNLKTPPIYSICQKAQPSLLLAFPDTTEYTSLSTHIMNIFAKTYGAEIEVTYPLLMGFVDSQEEPIAALGIRTTSEESPLFLEQYLEQPVEFCLQKIIGEKVPRHLIAEAGNLSSSGKGDILMLLYMLACYLDKEGMAYVIFTGTSLLRRYLHSLGLFPHVLVEATPEKLGADAKRWGSYYDTRPKVMAGSVAEFRAGLEQYFQNISPANTGALQ